MYKFPSFPMYLPLLRSGEKNNFICKDFNIQKAPNVHFTFYWSNFQRSVKKYKLFALVKSLF